MTDPYGYVPKSSSKFLKIEPNTNSRIRLTTNPVRFNKDFDGEKKERFAWIVIERSTSEIKFFEAGPQIYLAIKNLAQSSEWGDPKDYDITISRVGSGRDTSYQVMPNKPTPLTTQDKALIEGFEGTLEDLVKKADDDYDPYSEE